MKDFRLSKKKGVYDLFYIFLFLKHPKIKHSTTNIPIINGAIPTGYSLNE